MYNLHKYVDIFFLAKNNRDTQLVEQTHRLQQNAPPPTSLEKRSNNIFFLYIHFYITKNITVKVSHNNYTEIPMF